MISCLLPIIYLSFVSLGLPDSILGAAWPSMYEEYSVPVSYAGIVSMIIALGTIVSSLKSERLTRALGTGKVTAISVAMTAAALFGFSVSHSFWMLCLWAVPYGLGAGSVDASLNHYVALHYASRHMSWLHCMWGIGASLGPYVMGMALHGGYGWNAGYRWIAVLQVGLTAILMLSLPLWNRRGAESLEHSACTESKALTLRQIIAIPGAREIMITFFCYCAVEQTTGLWASSYLVLQRGLPAELAATCGSLFFLGITVGRAVSGFLTIWRSDTQMIRLGAAIILGGIAVVWLLHNPTASMAGFVLIGLGCAPVYPCIIHSTPAHFGADRSQALIGVQMASAYVGTLLMPPLFGVLAGGIGVGLLPVYLLVLAAALAAMHERLLRVKPAA